MAIYNDWIGLFNFFSDWMSSGEVQGRDVFVFGHQRALWCSDVEHTTTQGVSGHHTSFYSRVFEMF